MRFGYASVVYFGCFDVCAFDVLPASSAAALRQADVESNDCCEDEAYARSTCLQLGRILRATLGVKDMFANSHYLEYMISLAICDVKYSMTSLLRGISHRQDDCGERIPEITKPILVYMLGLRVVL